MNLAEYIVKRKEKEPGFTQYKFAKMLDVTPTTLTRIVRGRQILSAQKALQIHRLTKGLVHPWDDIILPALLAREKKDVTKSHIAKKKYVKKSHINLENSLKEHGVI